jgi:C1A family cysteine protease
MSYDDKSLRLLNSWGTNWADGGFFRVKDAKVLGLEFIDVFWNLEDLTDAENQAYLRDQA